MESFDMTAYPSLKRWLAAGLTMIVVGAVIYLVTRNGAGSDPLENAVAAQGGKKGQDWLMYGGSHSRNMVNLTAKNLPVKWTDKDGNLIAKQIIWSVDLGSKAYGGPIAAGGRIIVGTNNQKPRDPKWIKDGESIDLGVVMCFDQAKGDFLWQTVHEKLKIGRVQDWPREGICSTPCVEGDKFYYVSNRCELVCADVKTGKADWTLDMIKTLGVFPHNIADCSPLIVGDYVWLITANGVDGGHISVPSPSAPSFIKVDKKKGAVAWGNNSPTEKILVAPKNLVDGENFMKSLINRGELIQHGQWASPAYGVVKGEGQVIFPGGDGWIYSFDLAGKLLWRFDCNPKDAEYQLGKKGERNDFIATPVVYKDRVYIGTGQDPDHETGVGHLWCIDMTKRGDVSPELVTNKAVFPPPTKPNPNSALVWHYGGLASKADQAKLKRNYYFGRTMSTCAIHEDILYVADLDGILHCLDADKGTVHWEFNTKANTWSSPYYADGRIYLGNDEGDVFVFAHGKQLKQLAVNPMDRAVKATPIAVDGVLYVMTENKLYAIKE
jgi:outer membrane protein assembly factor BamB